MMKSPILSIKNMVCARCIQVVGDILQAEGIAFHEIELGKVKLNQALTQQELDTLNQILPQHGFALLEDKEAQLVEAVKHLIIRHIHHDEKKPPSLNFSDYLAQKIGTSYFTLSKVFSSTEGLTIEKYIILQKIERVKELLIYGEQTLSEIAFEMEYSSVAHLSGQFKKVTGLSPTSFRKQTSPRRNFLDDLKKPSGNTGE